MRSSPIGAGFEASSTFIPPYDLDEQNKRIEDICKNYPAIKIKIEELKKRILDNPSLLRFNNQEDVVNFLISEAVILRTSKYKKLPPDADSQFPEIVKDCRENIFFALKIEELESKIDSADLFHAIGVYHTRGWARDASPEEAFKYFSIASQLENTPSKHNLASAYFYGEGTEKNPDKALKILFELTKKINNSDEYSPDLAYNSLYLIAAAYENGDGVEKDQEKAFYILEYLALKKNYTKAKTRLATYYLHNFVLHEGDEDEEYNDIEDNNYELINSDNPIIKDVDKAINLLIAADEEGDKQARNYLRDIIINFIDDNSEYSLYHDITPAKLLEISQYLANKNDPIGLLNMARIYSSGELVAQNIDEAANLIKKAIESKEKIGQQISNSIWHITQTAGAGADYRLGIELTEYFLQIYKDVESDADLIRNAKCNLSLCYLDANQPEDVIKLLKEDPELCKNRQTVLISTANVFTIKGDIEKAKILLESVTEEGLKDQRSKALLAIGSESVNNMETLFYGAKIIQSLIEQNFELAVVRSLVFYNKMHNSAALYDDKKDDTKTALYLSFAINNSPDFEPGNVILKTSWTKWSGYDFFITSPNSTPLSKEEIIQFIRNLSQNEEVARARIAKNDTAFYKDTLVSDAIKFSLRDRDGNDLLSREDLIEIKMELKGAIRIGGGDTKKNSSFKNLEKFIEEAKNRPETNFEAASGSSRASPHVSIQNPIGASAAASSSLGVRPR